MTFRELEKEALQVQAPVEIATIVREKAARERTSISAVATELMCLGLRCDPTRFGIVAREPAAATA